MIIQESTIFKYLSDKLEKQVQRRILVMNLHGLKLIWSSDHDVNEEGGSLSWIEVSCFLNVLIYQMDIEVPSLFRDTFAIVDYF